MFLVSSCSCLCPFHWSHMLSREWRCSWNSFVWHCSNSISVINNFIAYQGVAYIRGWTVSLTGSIFVSNLLNRHYITRLWGWVMGCIWRFKAWSVFILSDRCYASSIILWFIEHSPIQSIIILYVLCAFYHLVHNYYSMLPSIIVQFIIITSCQVQWVICSGNTHDNDLCNHGMNTSM